jgi:hypothetical protein
MPVLSSSSTLTASTEASNTPDVSISRSVSPEQALPGRSLTRIVIDERARPENLDVAAIMAMIPAWRAGQQAARTRIFKDYILSTEPFRVKSGLY